MDDYKGEDALINQAIQHFI